MEELKLDRTISIKGNGKLFIKPDQIEVSLSLESVDENYEKAMLPASFPSHDRPWNDADTVMDRDWASQGQSTPGQDRMAA